MLPVPIHQLLRFLFSSLLSHPRRSPLDSQGLLHTLSSLSHPHPPRLCLTPAPASSQSSPRPYPHPMLSTPTPSLLVPFPILPPDTLEHQTPLDLWIFPRSPLDLPFIPWTPISGSFLASLLLLLLFRLHLHTLASQSPSVTLSYFYLDPLYHH